MIKNLFLTKQERESSGRLGLSGARSRFFANVVSNLIYTATSTLVTFLLTPFLIHHLGLAAYGMVPLVNTFTSYMAVVTQALQTSTSRYLTIDLSRGDKDYANKTFNTSLFGTLALIAVLAVAVFIFAYFFPTIFNVPQGAELDVSWLVITVAFSFFAVVLGGIFSISPFAHSQFLLINTAYFLGLMVRVALIIVLFLFLPPHLWSFGMATFLGSFVSLSIFMGLWRALTPELKIDLKAFDRSRLKELLDMGGWSAVNTAGAMLLGRVDLLAVNTYFGAATTGAYGSVAQFTTLLDYLVNTVSTVLRQIFTVQFGQGDFEGIRRVAIQSIKLLGLIMAIPIGLLCGLGVPILTIWLGKEFAYLNLLVIILTAHFSINLAVRPLLYVQNAYNKIRWPGIVTLIAGGVNLALAFAVGSWGKWGFLGIAAMGALVWTLRNTVYIPLYTSRVMKVQWWAFYPAMSFSLLGTAFIAFASYGLTLVRMPHNVFTLGITVAVVTLVYSLVVWLFLLTPNEKALLFSLLPIKFRRGGQSGQANNE